VQQVTPTNQLANNVPVVAPPVLLGGAGAPPRNCRRLPGPGGGINNVGQIDTAASLHADYREQRRRHANEPSPRCASDAGAAGGTQTTIIRRGDRRPRQQSLRDQAGLPVPAGRAGHR